MKNTVQFINDLVINDPEGFIARVEDDYHNRIKDIAQYIASNDDIRIVSIAGPSGSGKTTTAHLFCDYLSEMDEKTAVVSLDDFYLPLEKAPLLPDGSRDVESVEALDITLMKQCFDEIIKFGKTKVPNFSFKDGGRRDGFKTIDIGNRGIVIVEGLHALNPVITTLVPEKNIYKLYISVNCPIMHDDKVLLTSRKIRLIRRALRDEVFRDTDINETLSMWENVVKGEEKYLYCFKDSADVQLQTLHLYEICIYKERFLKLRDKVSKNAPCIEYFLETASAIENFVSLDDISVPNSSLIREFIGEGKYN